MSRRAAFLLLPLVLACTSGDGAAGSDTTASGRAEAAAPSGEGDLADISTYQLTMERIDRFYAAQRNLALRARDMSPAEREALGAADDDTDGGSLDDMARRLERNPAMRAAIRDAGLSTREYATIMMAMVQSAMAGAMVQTQPGANEDSLIRAMQANPANVRFLRENEAALARKQAELEAEMQRMGLDGSR